jgi:hypothetical protein
MAAERVRIAMWRKVLFGIILASGCVVGAHFVLDYFESQRYAQREAEHVAQLEDEALSLTDRLRSEDDSTRFVAIRSVRAFVRYVSRSRAEKWVDELVRIARTALGKGTAREALSALIEISPEDPRVTPLFVDFLNNEEEIRRATACAAFEYCNRLPDEVGKKLVQRAHTDPSPFVRICAAWSAYQHDLIDAKTARSVFRSAIDAPNASDNAKRQGELGLEMLADTK